MAELRIAQVATTDMSVALLLRDQIEALQEMGHDVTAVCAPGPRVASLRAEGVSLRTVEMAREISPFEDAKTLLALVRHFRTHRYDVVHTHTPKAGLLGPMAAQLAGVPAVVHTIHGLLYHDAMPAWRQGVFWLPEKITATFSDRLLAQSREDVRVAARTRLCRPGKITYLGNGIDTRTFAPANRRGGNGLAARLRSRGDEVIVGSVGRLVYEKGFAELFDAAEALTAARGNLKFVIIGPEEDDQNDAIDPRQLEALNRRGVVHFAGWQDADRMPEWYAAMDLFVLPSHREGVPRACMEAAASGLPVVATDIRGCREVVLDGDTGLLVPVKNAAALTRAIERLAGDAPLRERMGRRARQHIAENFDSRLVLERLRRFYERVEQALRPSPSTN